jgi:hypothetical protein
MSKRPSLSTQLADLTGKLRNTIAQSNRHYERCKLLEVENRDLRLLLKDHGIDVPAAARGIAGMKDAFQRLAAEVGYANVRIHGGQLQVRTDDRNWEPADA